MLSYVVSLPHPASRQSLSMTRRVAVPQQLSFLDCPLPEASVWEQLDPEPRSILIQALARLIARAALTNLTQEQTDERFSQDQTNSYPESHHRLCPPVHHLPSRESPRIDRAPVRSCSARSRSRLDNRPGDPHR